jgi:uncharacterized protein YbjT (DUF2867 family)
LEEQMSSPLLITGGTGTLGHHVVPLLRAAGRPVRVLSRQQRASDDGVEFAVGDLSTGEGLARAFEGVDTVVHLAGSAKGDDEKARWLVEAATQAGARHLVYISVVGADRIPVVSRTDRTMFGYFAAKRASEEIIAGSGTPWTTLRATQFHDLTLKTVQQMSKLPVIPIPSGVHFQPIASAEVAGRLVELSLGAPAGLVLDMAGPRIYPMADLVRSYLRATDKRRLLVPLRLPGKAAHAMRDGANLAPERAVGRRTWEDFLAEHVPSDRPVEAGGHDASHYAAEH